MGNTGLGVLINMMSGNQETVDNIKSALGKMIDTVLLDEENDVLKFTFSDGSKLHITDDGQSCCEHRFMDTDDDLSEFEGSVLLDMEVKNAPDQEDDYGEVHEIQFLDVKTGKGVFQMKNHNEHNGYYGGFWIVATV